MTATERAASLGTEHGTRAAEEWWSRVIERGETYYPEYVTATLDMHDEADALVWWPQPDLYGGQYPSPPALCEEVGVLRARSTNGAAGTMSELGNSICLAYEAAFTAAVEATIRAQCEQEVR